MATFRSRSSLLRAWLGALLLLGGVGAAGLLLGGPEGALQ